MPFCSAALPRPILQENAHGMLDQVYCSDSVCPSECLCRWEAVLWNAGLKCWQLLGMMFCQPSNTSCRSSGHASKRIREMKRSLSWLLLSTELLQICSLLTHCKTMCNPLLLKAPKARSIVYTRYIHSNNCVCAIIIYRGGHKAHDKAWCA